MNKREFKDRIAALIAQQRSAAYETPAPAGTSDAKPATKKLPVKETQALKPRRKKA